MNREQKINTYISEARRMAQNLMVERDVHDDAFATLAFTTAMNWLTALEGLRVLTPAEKRRAELYYGPL
jgi:hypothetical protein